MVRANSSPAGHESSDRPPLNWSPRPPVWRGRKAACFASSSLTVSHSRLLRLARHKCSKTPLRQFSVCYYLKGFTVKYGSCYACKYNKRKFVFTYLSKSVNQKFVNVDISCKVVLKCFVFNYGYLIYPTDRSLVISHRRYVLVFLLTSCNQFSHLCFVYKITVSFVARLYLIVWFERFVHILF